MSELKLTVTGMTCGGCESAVRRSLSMLDGVHDVTAWQDGRLVTLTYDPAKVVPGTIVPRIETLGYQVQA